MLKRKLTILSGLIVIGALALAACAPPGPIAEEATTVVGAEVVVTATPEPEPTEPPQAEREGLWYPIGAEPPTLDPQSSTDDVTSWLIIGQCIEGLFEYRGDGSIEPTGATGFEVSDNGLVYTIHLRSDAVWSDGEPVIAQHYVDGVIRGLEPGTEAYYAWLMWEVEGAEAFGTGETDVPSTVGVRAVDDHTLEIRLEAALTYFETILPFPVFYPVRLDIIEEHGDRWTEPGNYVSNGPYLLDSWEHGTKVVLVKNPAYWNADAVSIEKITLPIIQDDATIVDMYEKDELHSTGGGELGETRLADDAQRIWADPILSQELRELPRPGLHYIGLNTMRPPTDDLLVRKALASAFDRRTFIENVTWMPWLTPLSCTTPPNVMGHQPYGTCGYTFDPEQARALLAEAGYPDGAGFPELQLWVNWGGWNEEAAKTVAAIWEENLGISAEVRAYDWDVYSDYLDGCNQSKEELAACEVNTYQMGWYLDYGDPQNLLDVVFAPYSPFQTTGWESERYEELMALAGTEYDTVQRAEYYKEADRILCEEEVAIIPIYSYDGVTMVKKGVTFEYPPFVQTAFKHWALP